MSRLTGPPVDIGAAGVHGVAMRTTLTLDEDVFHAARALARTTDMTLGEVLSEVARQGFAAASATGERQGLSAARRPANAKVGAAKRARRVLAADGR